MAARRACFEGRSKMAPEVVHPAVDVGQVALEIP
jgi:hypothetical protein